MKKYAMALILLFLAGFAWAAQVSITLDENNRFKTDAPVLDMATSFGGDHVFILTPGKVTVFSSKGDLEDAFSVDPDIAHISITGYNLNGIENKIYLSSGKTGELTEMTYDFVFPIHTGGAPFLGLAGAPVSVVVFSDFQCPYCSRLKPLLELLLENNTETVKLIFKHYPLKSHKQAEPAAFAAIAAGYQGKFWEYHDALFSNSGRLDTPGIFTELAEDLHLDMDQFTKDLENPASRKRIEQDILDGKQAGIQGVPSIFINGRPLGRISPNGAQKIINSELNKLKIKN